jgi:hypothetical protein
MLYIESPKDSTQIKTHWNYIHEFIKVPEYKINIKLCFYILTAYYFKSKLEKQLHLHQHQKEQNS